MFNNSSKIMFILILMMSSLISISSNSWLGAWMGLEINLLSFIPLMNDNNLMSTEASLKYFMTQALASAILLFSIIFMLYNLNNENLLFKNNMINSMMMSALLLKSGAAPFHFWFPNLMEGLTWNNALILMTWQKLAPMVLISYNTVNYIMMISIMLSVIIGSIGGLNQTSLRKLMAFSSINHLGWMLTAIYFNEMIWLMYFFLYTLMNFNLIMFFNIFKISHLNQMFSMFFSSKMMKFSLFLNLLSLGGLPPFLGFFPKLMVIQFLSMNNQIILIVILTTTALITLYFYMRMCYSAFLLNYTEINFMNYMKISKLNMIFFLILSFISIFGLMFFPMFYFI